MSDRDLDKSGYGFQRVRTYLGPTLGWKDELVQPTIEITTGGVYNIRPGDSLILVNVAAGVQINLPDVRSWVQQPGDQPATSFERAITIKDLGGNAQNFNIIVVPFGQQEIDNIQTALVMSTNRTASKFVPLMDLTGWAVALATASGGGGGGGGDVFKAGNNTFTGVNTFVGQTSVPTLSAGENSTLAASTQWVKNFGYLDGNALAPYALIASPTFTGNPRAPTPAPGTNTTDLATTAFVQAAVTAGGTAAPASAEYITSSVNATLTAERVLTNTATITWDFSTAGQAKANTAVGGGNVSNVGTPTAGQYAKWTTATTIQGVLASTVLTDIGAQPLDPDLTSIAALPTSADTMIYFNGPGSALLTNLTPAARSVLDDVTVGAMVATLGAQPLDGDLTALSGLTGTNTMYYRSAVDIWSPVTFAGLSFSGGILTVTAGGGNVNNVATPTAGQYAVWTDATHIQGVAPAFAPIADPVFTGDPKAPTPATADNDTSIATTAFVKAQGYAPLANPVFTGDPQVPTPAITDNDTSIASTAFVVNYTLNAAHSFTAPQTATPVAITTAVAPNFATAQAFTVAATASAFSIVNPSANPATGTYVTITISMTGAGVVSFGANFKGLAAYIQSTWTSGTMRDHLSFRWSGTTYDLVGVAKGINQ